ncbi:MAG TPA: hypothetical protein VN838_12070 [Bradyrhizobium sp.]|nr:hypothetical protein [Bradyrhizobium sp.]
MTRRPPVCDWDTPWPSPLTEARRLPAAPRRAPARPRVIDAEFREVRRVRIPIWAMAVALVVLLALLMSAAGEGRQSRGDGYSGYTPPDGGWASNAGDM